MTFQELCTNVVNQFNNELLNSNYFFNKLESSDLLMFENSLWELITKLYNDLSESILQEYTESPAYKEQAESFSRKKTIGGLRKRDTTIQIRTGKEIQISNYYAYKVPSFYKGPRHTFHAIFGTMLKSSPVYYSTVSMTSVICPSFDVASEILQFQNIETDYNRVRNISIKLGKECLKNRVGIQLKPDETLEGKNVVLSIDGGRSRIRENKDELNKLGTHHLFDTAWREPKLFVIHIIDNKTGKQSKQELPLYDCTFGTEETFKLLSEYLEKMEIKKAKNVQFIADGAIWIWDRAKKMLLNLGVNEDIIVETLDFYHGTEHLSEIIKNLPKRISPEERKLLYLKLKDLLWNGKISDIKSTVQKMIKRTNKNIRKELKYFKKHSNRCNYAVFRESKLLCGSGIIESGIRRIINLRFKCPSSFWKIENLEALIFLRATLLSKRWNYMISNIAKS